MNIFKLFYILNPWQNRILLIFDIIAPLIVIFFGFLTSLIPIQEFFPVSSTPDIPIIVLFCLLLNKYSIYFVPVFFLGVIIFEYCFMIPTGTLFLHYSIFTLIGYFTWGNHLTNDISFRLVYFYFYATYFITLIFDIFIYYFILNGYLGFYQAFLFWISNIIIFPAVFYIIYYFILNKKPYHKENHL